MNSIKMDPLGWRKKFGRNEWEAPRLLGPDCWSFRSRDHASSIIVSIRDTPVGEWVHASISHRETMPTYDDLKMLHTVIFGDGYAYQVFVPAAQHVSYHASALHLWGRRDGSPVLPEFSIDGMI